MVTASDIAAYRNSNRSSGIAKITADDVAKLRVSNTQKAVTAEDIAAYRSGKPIATNMTSGVDDTSGDVHRLYESVINSISEQNKAQEEWKKAHPYGTQYNTTEEYDTAISDLNGLAGSIKGIAGVSAPDKSGKRYTADEIGQKVAELKKERGELQTILKYKPIASMSDLAEKGAAPSVYGDDIDRYLINASDGDYSAAFQNWLKDRGGMKEEDERTGTPMNSEDAYARAYNSGYTVMTDEEKKIYNYLYSTQGKNAADQYLKDMSVSLGKRRMQEETGRTKVAYQNGNLAEKAAMNIVSIPASVFGSAFAAASDLVNGVKGEYNPYSPAKTLSNFAQNVRGETVSDIVKSVENAGGSDTVGVIVANTYQAVMSGLDSMLGAATFGRGYTVLMGAGAASQRAKELYEQGATGKQIVYGSIGSGIAEALFEYVSLDKLASNFLEGNIKGVKDIVIKGLVQSGIEASEEISTEIANKVIDAINRGGTSDHARAVVKYINAGLTPEEAKKAAWKDDALDIFWAGYGGAISGGFSSAALGGINMVRTAQIGKPFNTENGRKYAASIGLENAPFTEAYKTAEKIMLGEDVSNFEIGKMIAESQTEQNVKMGKLYNQTFNSAEENGIESEAGYTIAQLAAISGREITFAKNMPIQNAEGVESNGKIMLNANADAKRLVNYVVKHELSHSIEGTRAWEEIARYVEAQPDYAERLQRMDDLHRDAGYTLTADEIRAEAVADWIGDNLYKSGFSEDITKDVKAGGAMMRALDAITLAVGKNSTDGKRLAAVQRTFARAFEQNKKETNNQYHLNPEKNNEYKKQIYEDIYYPKDHIMAEAFDRYLADATMDLTDGEKKNIVLSVGNTAYFVEATGFWRGNISYTMPILGNEEAVRRAKELFESVGKSDKDRRTVDNWAGVIQSEMGRSAGNTVGSTEERTAGGTDAVYGRQSGRNDIGYSWEDDSNLTLDKFIKLPDGRVTNEREAIEEYYNNQEYIDDAEQSSNGSDTGSGFSNAKFSFSDKSDDSQSTANEITGAVPYAVQDDVTQEEKLKQTRSKEAEEAYREGRRDERKKARERKARQEEKDLRKQAVGLSESLKKRMANPTKKDHIPMEMMETVLNLLDSIKEDPYSIQDNIRYLDEKKKNAKTIQEYDRYDKKIKALRKSLESFPVEYGRMLEQYRKTIGDQFDGDNSVGMKAQFTPILEKVKDIIGDKTLIDLNAQELREVVEALGAVVRQVNESNKAITLKSKEDTDEFGKQMISEIKNTRGIEKHAFLKKFNMWQMRPNVFFNDICGWLPGNAGQDINNAISESETTELKIKQKAGELFQEFVASKDYENLKKFGEKYLVDIGLQDERGKTIKTTRGIMLSLYMSLICDGNRIAIEDGGIVLPQYKKYYSGHIQAAYDNGQRLTITGLAGEIGDVLEQMKTAQGEELAELEKRYVDLTERANQDLDRVKDKIESMMTDGEKKFIADVQKWFNEISKDEINKTTMDVWGYAVARVGKYFPIYRDKNFVTQGMDTLVSNYTIANWGNAKTRTRSKIPVLIADISSVLNKSVNDTAKFAGWLGFSQDMNRLWNYSDVETGVSFKQTLGQKYGSDEKTLMGTTGTAYFKNLIGDLCGIRQGEDGKFADFLRSMAVRGTLSMNLRVAFSQAASFPTAAAATGWDYLTKGITVLPHMNKEYFERARKYSTYFYERSKGSGGTEQVYATQDNGNKIDKLYNEIDRKTNGWLFGWCQKMDVFTVARLWAACEARIADTTDLESGTEKFYQAVGKELDRVIRETQPNFTTAERSDLLRSKAGTLRFLTMYDTQRNQNWNILYDGIARYSAYAQAYKNGTVTEEQFKSAKQQMVQSLSAVIAGAIEFAVVKALINLLMHRTNGYKDKKTDEVTFGGIVKGIGKETVSSIAGNVTFGSIIYDVIAARAFGDKYYGISDSSLGNLVELLEDIATGKFNSGKAIDYALQDAFAVIGVPAKNVRDLINGVVYHIEDIKNGEFFSYNAGGSTTDAIYYRRLYKAIESGDKKEEEKLRAYFKSLDKSDSDINLGMRNAVKIINKRYEKEKDKYFERVMGRMIYQELTDKEKKRVQSGLENYVADLLLNETAGTDMTKDHQKAQKMAGRGLDEADYYLYQVVKQAQMTDANKDGKTTKAEYSKIVRGERDYTDFEKQLLISLKSK